MEKKGCFLTTAARFFLFIAVTKLIFRLFPQEISGYIWLAFIAVIFLFGMRWKFSREDN